MCCAVWPGASISYDEQKYSLKFHFVFIIFTNNKTKKNKKKTGELVWLFNFVGIYFYLYALRFVSLISLLLSWIGCAVPCAQSCCFVVTHNDDYYYVLCVAQSVEFSKRSEYNSNNLFYFSWTCRPSATFDGRLLRARGILRSPWNGIRIGQVSLSLSHIHFQCRINIVE